MTEKCFDIGTIQAFLDGELGFEQSESVAHHVAACDECALMLAVAEEESAFAFSALEPEFNTLVPTQRLWTKINDSIERENEKKSFWTPIYAFFARPSIAAFASLLIVAGLFAIALNRGNDEETKIVALNNPNQTIASVPVAGSPEPNEQVAQPLPIVNVAKIAKISELKNNRNDAGAVKTKFTAEASRTPNVKSNTGSIGETRKPAVGESLAGEESYLKTIATLTETVKNRKDEVLRPSARFAFERDLAVAENAIETMKAKVKQNPKDEAAKQILRASYENKIDLLNSVADKTELMASLK